MRDYEARRVEEGELTEQDAPPEMLADVEAGQSEDDRCDLLPICWTLRTFGKFLDVLLTLSFPNLHVSGQKA